MPRPDPRAGIDTVIVTPMPPEPGTMAAGFTARGLDRPHVLGDGTVWVPSWWIVWDDVLPMRVRDTDTGEWVQAHGGVGRYWYGSKVAILPLGA